MAKLDEYRPTATIQLACIIALVIVVGIDAFATDFEVHIAVYAIFAGILFGVGNIKDVIGGRR